MVSIGKGEFITKVLVEPANIIGFFDLLKSKATDEIKAAEIAWNESTEIQLDSPFLLGMVDGFLTAGAVNQAAVDRMTALTTALAREKHATETQLDPKTIPLRTFKLSLSAVPEGEQPLTWVTNFVSSDCYPYIEDGFIIIKLIGVVNHPEAVEVF